MPSDQSDSVHALPALAPQTAISRKLSAIEYYHASIGTHPRTLDPSREVVLVLEGEGDLPTEAWRRALDAVAAANPGVRLRLIGRRRRARWESDGPMPRLRIVDDCGWDALSGHGSEFIYATPLSLEQGPCVELIIAHRPDGKTLVILRTHHAIMDGSGILHFLRELFRALRGEPLLGTNAGFSDVELLRSLGIARSQSERMEKIATLPPDLSGADAKGDTWRRIQLGPARKHLLAHLAVAIAEYAHRTSPLPALIAIPVDLRRHVPGLLSTGNFSSVVRLRLDPGEGPERFQERLQALLAQRVEAGWSPKLEWLRALPSPWLDRMLSRTAANYRRKAPLETAMISNIGFCNPADYSAPGFVQQGMLGVPLAGGVFAALMGTGNGVELMLNLPNLLGSEGRFDAFAEFLRERLRVNAAAPMEWRPDVPAARAPHGAMGLNR